MDDSERKPGLCDSSCSALPRHDDLMSNFARRILIAMTMSRIDAEPSRLISANCVMSMTYSAVLFFTSVSLGY